MMVTYLYHSYALYCIDNDTLYGHTKEAVRGTAYAAAAKPFEKCCEGSGKENSLLSCRSILAVTKWPKTLSVMLKHTSMPRSGMALQV